MAAAAAAAQVAPARPVRALVITLGGDRQRAIREHLEAVGGFEVFFSPGVPSRTIRTKEGLRAAAVACGLFTEEETTDGERAGGAIRGANGVGDRDISRGGSEAAGVAGGGDDSGGGSGGDNVGSSSGIGEGGEHDGPGDHRDPAAPLPYTFAQLWRDCRSINRQRAVLACLFAHVRALKHARDAIPGGVDVVFEDNVRFLRQPGESAARVRRLQAAAPGAVVRLFGFGGPNDVVRELFAAAVSTTAPTTTQAPAAAVPGTILSSSATTTTLSDHAHGGAAADGGQRCFTQFLFSRSPFRRRPEKEEGSCENGGDGNGGAAETAAGPGSDRASSSSQRQQQLPQLQGSGRGAPLVWGCFAYWVHASVLDRFLQRLRAGLPGSLLSKRNKRQKTFHVRPFDKILYDFGLAEDAPAGGGERVERLGDLAAEGGGCERRRERPGDSRHPGAAVGGGGAVGGIEADAAGPSAVVALQPCCYRAPMLPSLIHRHYDAGFCSSSEAIMRLSGDCWGDLLLTSDEAAAVARHATTGEWTHPEHAKLSDGWGERRPPKAQQASKPLSPRAQQQQQQQQQQQLAQPAAAASSGGSDAVPYVLTEADLRKRAERQAKRRREREQQQQQHVEEPRLPQ